MSLTVLVPERRSTCSLFPCQVPT